jgi:hypothetical protein
MMVKFFCNPKTALVKSAVNRLTEIKPSAF